MRRRPDPLACIGLAALLLLASCAPTLNLDASRPSSQALSSQAASPLKDRLAAWIPSGESGFHLLQDGQAALAARLALAQRATRTLDVQYYLFHNDTTGKLVAASLLAAADRGVRVRLLIDDIDTADKELGLATLNAHPNIQVRLFNPFHTRSTNLLVKGWQALRERVRLNRRMHNKLFIADNKLGITGGRNIGDEYFAADNKLAFVDLDVAAAGTIVDAMSQSFDAYWNSEAAVPASALPVRPSDRRLERTTLRLQAFRARHLDSDYGRALTAADPIPGLLRGTIPWQIAHADLIVDPPEKVLKRSESSSRLLMGQLAGLGVNPTRLHQFIDSQRFIKTLKAASLQGLRLFFASSRLMRLLDIPLLVTVFLTVCRIPPKGDTVMLSDTAIKNAKPAKKPYKLADERGMYLLINHVGKYWRLDYRFDGKRKTLTLGVYPDVPLKAARNKRDEARTLLADGVDPGANRKALESAKSDRAANSFEVIAREWFAKFASGWVPSHGDKIIRRLERDIFPWIGRQPIADVTAPGLLAVLRRIEERGAVDTAHRALQNCGQIFRYAIATGRALRDPSGDLRGALPPVKENHLAAMTDPKDVAALLRAMDCYQGSFVTKCALRLAPLVFVRPGELRKAEWAEIDLDHAEWNIPAVRMKMKEPHLVPLASQAVEILRELQALTDSGRYVFPGARTNGRPMSDNAILAALRRMGFAKDEMSGHGFRAMARTILDEVLGVRPDFIEHQLAHAVRDPNGRAYNRTAHLDERRKMMQEWADYLDKLKAGAAVIPLHGQAA